MPRVRFVPGGQQFLSVYCTSCIEKDARLYFSELHIGPENLQSMSNTQIEDTCPTFPRPSFPSFEYILPFSPPIFPMTG